MHRLLIPGSLLLVAATCNGPDDLPQEPEPELLPGCLRITPNDGELSFPDVDFFAGQRSSSAGLTLTTACDGPVVVSQLALPGDSPFSVPTPTPIALGTAEAAAVDVQFAPTRAGDYEAVLLVHSDDPDRPTREVRLLARALAPIIDVEPDSYDYGTPYIGCESGQPFSIRNLGNMDLEVTEVEVYSASVEEFSVDLDAFNNGDLPFTIGPYSRADGGPSVDVYLDYLPLDTFADSAFLQVGSNDPFRPEVVLETEGSGTYFGDNIDVFELPESPQIDVLLTLDRSGSLTDVNDAVAEGIGGLTAALADMGADYHVAAVVSDSGCVLGPDAYIDSSFSAADARAALATMADTGFDLDTSVTNSERGYTLAEAALTPANTGSGGCNEGLLRPGAPLSLIHISDEAEQSVNSWSYYVAVFQARVADPEDVRINAVVGDYPSGCAWAEAGVGYYEGTVATGGLFLSICTATDWEATLATIGSDVRLGGDHFQLSQQPVPERIQVVVDGVRVSHGWAYDLSSNSIVFASDAVPDPGSVVEVSYARLPDCEG